ncbi:MAG: Rne/Rng family ribonuclease [Candidatus Methylomirabilia bacterium]
MKEAIHETGRKIGRLLGRSSTPDLAKKYPRQLVLSSTPWEVRVALIEDGLPIEYLQEWRQNQGNAGSVYKGRVTKVLPGMQAAFVDIGQEKAGFLYISEISEELIDDGDGAGDDDIEHDGGGRRKSNRTQKIQDLLKADQEVLVQIAKESIGTKGARLTSHISLPGRYLVLMPTESHVGVSRRIVGDKERHRLREIIHRLKPEGHGVIIRTEAEDCSEEELAADLTYLTRMWDRIRRDAEAVAAPALIHADLDVVLKAVRDLFTSDTDRLLIDNKEDYRRVEEFVKTFQPHLRSKLAHYAGREPLFDAMQIETELRKVLERKVWLKSGGHLTMDHTEALVAIDVNTGRFVGKGNLEETVLKTNLEAVKEIARQIRLRNLGGIIVLDLIDMNEHKNREKVSKALEEALRPDKANTKILKISEFGLVEMTRKRTRESVLQQQTKACTCCDGKGFVKDPVAVCHEIFRDLLRLAPRTREKRFEVHAHADVVTLLLDAKRTVLEEIEELTKKKVTAKVEVGYHQEKYEIVPM